MAAGTDGEDGLGEGDAKVRFRRRQQEPQHVRRHLLGPHAPCTPGHVPSLRRGPAHPPCCAINAVLSMQAGGVLLRLHCTAPAPHCSKTPPSSPLCTEYGSCTGDVSGVSQA